MREFTPLRRLAGAALAAADHQGKKLAAIVGRGIGKRHHERIDPEIYFFSRTLYLAGVDLFPTCVYLIESELSELENLYFNLSSPTYNCKCN